MSNITSTILSTNILTAKITPSANLKIQSYKFYEPFNWYFYQLQTSSWLPWPSVPCSRRLPCWGGRATGSKHLLVSPSCRDPQLTSEIKNKTFFNFGSNPNIKNLKCRVGTERFKHTLTQWVSYDWGSLRMYPEDKVRPFCLVM